MDTRQALHELGVDPVLAPQQRDALDRDGFFVVENALTREQRTAMAEEFDRLTEAEAGGSFVIDPENGVTRLSDIFNKTTVFDPCSALQPVLAASYYLLGDFKLHGANIREPHKGAGAQPLHSDAVKRHDTDWQLINALICLDELTLEAGPTRIVPGSHRWPHYATFPDNYMPPDEKRGHYGDQSKFPDDPFAKYPGEMYLTAPAGAVAVCNASLWHSGTANKNGKRRRMLHLTYTRRDLRQQFNQQEHLTNFLYDRLSSAQRYLFDVEAPSPAGAERPLSETRSDPDLLFHIE